MPRAYGAATHSIPNYPLAASLIDLPGTPFSSAAGGLDNRLVAAITIMADHVQFQLHCRTSSGARGAMQLAICPGLAAAEMFCWPCRCERFHV